MQLQSISKQNKLIFGIVLCVALLILYNILNSYLDDKLTAKLNKEKNEIVALISSNSSFNLKVIKEDNEVSGNTIKFNLKNSLIDNYYSESVLNDYRFELNQDIIQYKSKLQFWIHYDFHSYDQNNSETKTIWDGRFNSFYNSKIEEIKDEYALVLYFDSPEWKGGWTINDKEDRDIEKFYYQVWLKLNLKTLDKISFLKKIQLFQQDKILKLDTFTNHDNPVMIVSKLYAKDINNTDDFVPIFKRDKSFEGKWYEIYLGTINISLGAGNSENDDNTTAMPHEYDESDIVVDSSSTVKGTTSTGNEINNYYKVTSDKAYFYNSYDENIITTSYLIKDDVVFINQSSNGFGYASFQNVKGIITNGWIKLSDVIIADE